MKKTFFCLSSFLLFSNLTFSQIGYQSKLDTTIKVLKNNSYRLENDYGFKAPFKLQFKSSTLITENSLNKYLNKQNLNKEKKHNVGVMPCLIPEGYFPIKIMTPDSSKRYSLIIKQF